MANRSRVLLMLLSLTVSGFGYSPMKKEQTRGSPSTCALNVEVKGGQFSPQTCTFEIITRGEACSPNTACPPDYALSMKDTERSHIQEVTLFGFRSFTKQTFHFDPSKGAADFKGQALDERFTARNLLKGEVTLEPLTTKAVPPEQRVKLSFDVSFSNNIRIQGSGEIPVERVSAP